MIVIFGAIGVIGVVLLGARQFISAITIVNVPIVGEWRAANKPWRIAFFPDKTLVSSTGASPLDAPRTWTAAPGAYSLDYAGALSVKIDKGGSYNATLTAESPNRFDLIDSETEGVTVFERASATPNSSKTPGG